MGNKKNISVRLTDSDLRSLKSLSTRLDIKESDLFRYAVKTAMHKVMPLLHRDLAGPEFLMALLDCGEEMLKHFEFDTHQLGKIVNSDQSQQIQVSVEDIELVAIAAVNEAYLVKRLIELGQDVPSKDFAYECLQSYIKDKYSPLIEAQGSSHLHLTDEAIG